MNFFYLFYFICLYCSLTLLSIFSFVVHCEEDFKILSEPLSLIEMNQEYLLELSDENRDYFEKEDREKSIQSLLTAHTFPWRQFFLLIAFLISCGILGIWCKRKIALRRKEESERAFLQNHKLFLTMHEDASIEDAETAKLVYGQLKKMLHRLLKRNTGVDLTSLTTGEAMEVLKKLMRLSESEIQAIQDFLEWTDRIEFGRVIPNNMLYKKHLQLLKTTTYERENKNK